MNKEQRDVVESRLIMILKEMDVQAEVAESYSDDVLSFSDEMEQVREFIEVAGEYGLAFELMVVALEAHPFILSGRAAVALLELGLIFGYKTDRIEDERFDLRHRAS